MVTPQVVSKFTSFFMKVIQVEGFRKLFKSGTAST